MKITPKPENYGGGGINGKTFKKDPSALKKIGSGKAKYNWITGETEIENDMKNTAKGRGRRTDNK